MTGLPTGIRTKSGFLYIEFQVRGKRHYESTGLSAQTAQGKPHHPLPFPAFYQQALSARRELSSQFIMDFHS